MTIQCIMEVFSKPKSGQDVTPTLIEEIDIPSYNMEYVDIIHRLSIIAEKEDTKPHVLVSKIVVPEPGAHIFIKFLDSAFVYVVDAKEIYYVSNKIDI